MSFEVIQQGRFLAAHIRSGAGMHKAQLAGASAELTNFTGAALGFADLSHAVIKRANFTDAHLFMANLHEIDEENTIWNGSSKPLARGTDQKRRRAEQWGKK